MVLRVGRLMSVVLFALPRGVERAGPVPAAGGCLHEQPASGTTGVRVSRHARATACTCSAVRGRPTTAAVPAGAQAEASQA